MALTRLTRLKVPTTACGGRVLPSALSLLDTLPKLQQLDLSSYEPLCPKDLRQLQGLPVCSMALKLLPCANGRDRQGKHGTVSTTCKWLRTSGSPLTCLKLQGGEEKAVAGLRVSDILRSLSSGVPGLRELTLLNLDMRQGMEHLQQLTGVTKLDIRQCLLDAEGLRELAALGCLRDIHIDLKGSGVEGEAEEERWGRVEAAEELVLHKLPLLEHRKRVSLQGSPDAIFFGSALK